MALSCGGKCMKLFLIVVNTIFMLLGLGILIPGILMLVDVDVINDNILPLLKQLSFGALNVGDLAKGLSLTLIIFGTFVLIVSMLGCCGAMCQQRLCLVVYAALVLVFFLAKLVVVILWFVMNDKIQSWMKTELLSQLETNYKHNDLTSEEISTAWNYMFMTLSCCGVNAVTGTTNDFDNSVWIASAGSKEIPTFCCSGVTASNYASYSNTACTDSVTSGYYTKGCYDATYSLLDTYSTVFMATGICILLVEIVAFIGSIVIIKQGGEDGKSLSGAAKMV
ncbi:tetraspanin-9-like [Saccostrea echinata]|uniref:tetraspanin-9-like n=1 Tax=Saccostrea echinata TaxID=191078 RepID=UPI002A7EC26E|nr:tetraspanin-9-like [Saccostrea echinata]